MKRVLHFTICSALLFTAGLVPAFAGEVIDGVVASVNRHPILRSEWEEAANFEAFMQQKPASQITQADRALALQHLIDRQLLIAQMGNANAMEPSDASLQQDLAKLRAQLPKGNNEPDWQRLLARYGLTEDMVKQHLRDQFQVMNFIEVRLRPNVHVNDDEVAAYYHNQLIPDLQKNSGTVVPLDEVKSRIHELLTQQHIDELLDAWLHNLRQQAEIHSRVAFPAGHAPEEGAMVFGGN